MIAASGFVARQRLPAPSLIAYAAQGARKGGGGSQSADFAAVRTIHGGGDAEGLGEPTKSAIPF